MIGTQWDGRVESNDIKFGKFGNHNKSIFRAKCIQIEVNNMKQPTTLNGIHDV